MKKLLSIFVALIICLSAFPMTIFADDEIPDGFTYVATYYYDKDNPYNNSVHGNSDYAYTCYVKYYIDHPGCLFIHNGKVVTDDSIITALSKMYFANNWQNHEIAVSNVELAKQLIEIASDLKVTSFVDGLATLASECLGALMSVYVTGGAATISEIVEVVVEQSVEQVKENLIDVSNVISKLQTAMIYTVADEMEDSILQIRNMGGEQFMYYSYCEEFCNVFSNLERLALTERILISSEVEKLDPDLIDNLAHYFGIAANSFVGSFSEILVDLGKIEDLINTKPTFIAETINMAIKLQNIKDSLSDIEQFKEIFDAASDEMKALFDIFDAYEMYNSLSAPSLNTVISSSFVYAEDYKFDEDENGSANDTTIDTDTPDSDEPVGLEPALDINAFNTKLNEFRANVYANNSTYVDNPNLTGGYQCFGFANELAVYIFGSYPTSSMQATTINEGWSRAYGASAVDKLCVGDIVRFEYHSIFITKIDGDTIYYCQANVPINTNKVTYDNTISRSNLKTLVDKVLTSPGATKTGWVAHFEAFKMDTTRILNVNYNTNGGNLPEAELISETYKVTHADGLNVRSQPDSTDSSTIIGALRNGTTVTVTEKRVGNSYTWGKIAYNGGDAWIALDSSWITKTEALWSHLYYADNGQIFNSATERTYTKSFLYGGLADCLDEDVTFGLYRDGYTFKGWSLSATDGELIDKNKPLKAEDLLPSMETGDKTVTVYAVWEQNPPPVTDTTVESIYVSSIPQKGIYYVGEDIDEREIQIVVIHNDGTLEYVNSGFVCSPSTVMNEGTQTITVIYEGKTATFDITATKSKLRANNATALVDSTGYFMPDSASGTLFNIGGAYKDDIMQVLCKDGDYYLCLFPWGATTTTTENGVLLYFNADDIQVNGTVPSAADYFSMNPTGTENAVTLTETVIYHRPDGGAKPVSYNGNPAPEIVIASGERIRVLFEMDGYYCVQTGSNTGFVDKDSVKIDPIVYTIEVTPTEIPVQGNTIDFESISVNLILTDGSQIKGDYGEEYDIVIFATNDSYTQSLIICDGFASIVTLYEIDEPVEAPTGDVDGDGDVDTDDAIRLLLHCFYSDDYPLSEDGDVNGDGEVNTDDAIYLLLHVFYPGDYPVYLLHQR